MGGPAARPGGSWAAPRRVFCGGDCARPRALGPQHCRADAPRMLCAGASRQTTEPHMCSGPCRAAPRRARSHWPRAGRASGGRGALQKLGRPLRAQGPLVPTELLFPRGREPLSRLDWRHFSSSYARCGAIRPAKKAAQQLRCTARDGSRVAATRLACRLILTLQ